MPEEIHEHRLRDNSLAMALSLAIGIAVIMVVVTTTSFFKSSAYITVKQIQTGNQFVRSIDKDSIDTVSPINASDIDSYASSIRSRIDKIDDNSDFGPNAVSDNTLGLY